MVKSIMQTMNQMRVYALFSLIGLVVGIGLISCQSPESEQQMQSEKPDDVAVSQHGQSFKVTKADLELIRVTNTSKSLKWPVSGRVVPKNTTQLFSEVQGKVLNVNFRLKEGISFRKGEVLLSLDGKEFSLELESQRSAFLNILTGMMPDLKADYPDNYTNWLNYVGSYEGGKPLEELPKTTSEGERYFVTANQVYSTYYSIKALEERLGKYQILAPYSGMVTSANADKGSLVSPGQLLGTIINNTSYELEAAASLEIASKLKVGDRVIFTSNEMPGKWTGNVLRINDIVDAKTQNIPIYFEIEGANLKAGMYLEGKFSGEAYADVFTIPSSILTRDNKVLLLAENTILSKTINPVEFLQDSIIVRGLSDRDILIANQFDVPVEGLKLSL